MSKYKCPVCSIIADIDKEKKTVTVLLPPGTLGFPTHPCELAKAVTNINLKKLEKLD